MTPEEAQQIQAHIQGIAQILYKNTNQADLVSLEAIEKSVRDSDVRTYQPPGCPFFIKQVTGTTQGRKRQLKSCVGTIQLSKKQAERLELAAHSRISPLRREMLFKS